MNQRTKCREFDEKSRDNIDPYDGRIDKTEEYPAPVEVDSNTLDDQPCETQVPIVVILSILMLYIFLGTLIFSVWENWSFIDGAYFCFVTISTIGFADLVPRKTFQGPNLQLFACCTYLIVGLILVTMSFTLLESQLMWRCKRMAMKLKRRKNWDQCSVLDVVRKPRSYMIRFELAKLKKNFPQRYATLWTQFSIEKFAFYLERMGSSHNQFKIIFIVRFPTIHSK